MLPSVMQRDFLWSSFRTAISYIYLFIDLQSVLCFSRKYLFVAIEEVKRYPSSLQLVSLSSFDVFGAAEV